MNDQKVATEVAEAEFNRFGEMMDLDFNIEGMDTEDLKGFQQQKRRIVSAIESGAMVINDNGEPVFTPQRTKDIGPITFREPTGATYMAMDRKKKDQDMGKFFAVMSDMTGVHSGQLSKLAGSDTKVCQAVVALFLA